MATHEHFMALAINKAREGIGKGQTPFGACIVLDGKVLSCAHNTVWAQTDITAHAEVCAIREACRQNATIDLSGAVIYSTCEPCPMCYSACHWARVGTICYGATIADAADAGFNEMAVSNEQIKQMAGHNVVIIPHVMHEACKALFDEWRANKGRGY